MEEDAMRGLIEPRNLVGLGAALALASTLTGCSYVKRQEFDDQLASVRGELQQEMAAGDQGVSEALGSRIDGVEARLAALESALQTLESEFDATVERLETAIRFNMPVYFAFDDDELRPQDRPVLDRFAEVANEYYPGTLVTVEGFTDSSGSQAYNLRLGMRRAEAVKTYLVSAGGMNPNLMKAVSYGEEAPRQVAEGATGPGESGWENRRVVLVIDHGGTPPAGGS
jgi:outer membrane protein OmpA-like peptidoglycan-associated protein